MYKYSTLVHSVLEVVGEDELNKIIKDLNFEFRSFTEGYDQIFSSKITDFNKSKSGLKS